MVGRCFVLFGLLPATFACGWVVVWFAGLVWLRLLFIAAGLGGWSCCVARVCANAGLAVCDKFWCVWLCAVRLIVVFEFGLFAFVT